MSKFPLDEHTLRKITSAACNSASKIAGRNIEAVVVFVAADKGMHGEINAPSVMASSLPLAVSAQTLSSAAAEAIRGVARDQLRAASRDPGPPPQKSVEEIRANLCADPTCPSCSLARETLEFLDPGRKGVH